VDNNNPVSDVVRVSDGQGEIVLSAKITVEGWVFGAVRVNGSYRFNTMAYLCSERGHVNPPRHIKREARRRAGKLFSEIRTIRPRVPPNQGVLIP
jgi:hypothetical protein